MKTFAALILFTNLLFAECKIDFTCTQGSLKRTVSIVYEGTATKKSPPCKVMQNKNGEEKQLWMYQVQGDVCLEKGNGYIEKLKSNGAQCVQDADTCK